MTQQYVILYEYYSWDLGCGCCSDSSSEVHIFKKQNGNECYESIYILLIRVMLGLKFTKILCGFKEVVK